MKLRILIIFVLFLSSCNHPNIKQLLENVEHIINSNPDSALTLLESLPALRLLPCKEYAEYELARLKAKDKCYMDLAGDTAVVTDMLNFYETHKNEPLSGWAYYYAGRVFHDANEEEKAYTCYMEASDYARKYNNDELGTLSNYYLANFHARQLAYDKAITGYQQALKYNISSKEKKFESILLNAIGFSFGQYDQIDSAFIYLKKAYTIALLEKDTIQITNTLNDLSLFLLKNNQYEEAKTYMLKSMDICPDNISLFQYIILADIYLKTNQTDSAVDILKQQEAMFSKTNDIEIKTIFFKTLSKIEEKRKNFSTSLQYHKLYVSYLDSVYRVKRNNSLAEVEQKFNYIKIKDYNDQLEDEKRTTIFIIIILFILFSFLYYQFWGKIKQKRNALYEAEEKLDMLQNMLKKSDNQKIESDNITTQSKKEKENLLKSLLIQQLDISTKIALLHAQNAEKNQLFLTKFNDIMYGEQRSFKLNWEELYPLFNILFDNFVDTLKSRYPILSEKDVQLCCLLLIELSTAEITFLMDQSLNTVHKRKTEIRKKLMMPAGTDIASFFKKNGLI